MQIAQIVPKVKTQDEGVFDYEIPAEFLADIRIGQLVLIPFHGRNVEGIIVDIARRSKIEKLKPIIKIIDPIPAVDDTHIKLSQWMSDYYLAPLGKTLFENIVPPAKRAIIRSELSDTLLSAAASRRVVPAHIQSSSKKYLIISDFSSRLKFYQKAIEKTAKNSRSVIILVPDNSLIPYFTRTIKDPISIIHAGLTKTQRWQTWNDIRQGKSKIIIGSQSALFAPIKNLGLIIIDQEENETYKNDRSPRFHCVDVARKLSDLTGANLILGTIAPRIETYHDALDGKYKILAGTQNNTYDATIVDMNTEKYIISNPLEKAIDENLNKNLKTLIVYNRKGEGTKFSCPDCQWIATCEKCGLPLVPQKAENICYRCQKTYLQPDACPKCQSIRLKPMGIGTARINKFLSDLFSKAKIIQIEKDTAQYPLRDANWDIAITTSFGLKFSWPKINLVAILDADQGLNFPDFSSASKSFQTFYKFLKIGDRGIVQTNMPESDFVKSLAQLDFKKFFLNDVSQRRKFGFPPFAKLIRLLYKNSDEEVCKKESGRVYKLLNETVIPSESEESFGDTQNRSIANAISDIRQRSLGKLGMTMNDSRTISISPPYPAFILKGRGKFRYQIVIKIQRSAYSAFCRNKIKDQNTFERIICSLPKGWIVDVEPVNLL